MPRQTTSSAVATIGVDIGKNTFHLVCLSVPRSSRCNCSAIEEFASRARSAVAATPSPRPPRSILPARTAVDFMKSSEPRLHQRAWIVR